MSKKRPLPPEIHELIKELATLLEETDPVPIKQIRRIVLICGADFAREMYKATEEVEAQGGMMLRDNSRRRTRGGVFFHLVRNKVDAEKRQIIFPGANRGKSANQSIPLGVPLLTWEDRIALIQSLQSGQGEVKSMKIIMSGRPGAVEKRAEVIVTTMSFIASAPNLPRGIPTPPTTPTMYAVYMAPKQWEKVEKSIADPADNLLIDGICAFDPDTNSMAVFALTVRSELMEAKAKEEKKPPPKPPKPPKAAAPAAEGKAAAAPKKAGAASGQQQGKSTIRSRIADLEPEPVVAAPVPINPNLPPEVGRKLSELYTSASLFRQKVATIQGNPAGQQFGLEMTQKLLKNVEDEIAALEKKYNS